MTDTLIGQLKQFELFKSLPESAMADLAERFTQVGLSQDEVLFNKGDAGDALYILRRGRLKMVSMDSEGKEMVLNQVGPGAVIGEMALIDREPRSAGVVALTDAALLRLSTEDFLGMLAVQPTMGLEISRNLIQRLRFATTYIENAIEWSQKIAKGDYSFIESVDEAKLGDSENTSDKERAKRFLGTFFQMVQDIKAREDELKKELVKLRVEIDHAKRKSDVSEITESEFFRKLRENKSKPSGGE